MTNGEREAWIFLSHPQTIIGFFFLLTIKYSNFILKKGSLKFPNMLRCTLHDVWKFDFIFPKVGTGYAR